MVQLQEVTLDELKHLVSDRAIQGETMLLKLENTKKERDHGMERE